MCVGVHKQFIRVQDADASIPVPCRAVPCRAVRATATPKLTNNRPNHVDL